MSNLSFIRHTGDGSTSQYTFAIAGEDLGYFRTSDIHVYVDGEEVSRRINIESPHLVILNEAPADGSDVLIRREMPYEQPYANFERGNNFGHRQVNNTFVQQLYLTQELLDGFKPEGYYEKQDINMNGNRVRGLPSPINDDEPLLKGDISGDGLSVSKQYVDAQIDGVYGVVDNLSAGDIEYLSGSVDDALSSSNSFSTVQEVKSYSKIDGLLGKTVRIDERLSDYIVTREPQLDNGMDVIGLDDGITFLVLVPDTPIKAEGFGVNGESDDEAFKRCLEYADGRKVTCGTLVDIREGVTVTDVDVDLEYTGRGGISGDNLPAATSLGSVVALTIQGSLGSSTPVTADLQKFSEEIKDSLYTTIEVEDGSLFEEGDIVLLKSDQLFDNVWAASGNKRGELLKVSSVDGNTITTSDNNYFSYLSSANATLTKVNTINLKVYGGKSKLGGVGSGHVHLVARYVENIDIASSCDRAESTAFGILTCYQGDVNVVATRCTSPSALGNSGYGVSVSSGSRYINVRGYFYKCRHAVTGGGDLPAIFINVEGTAVECGIGTNAWDCHEPCFKWVFDVYSYGGGGGIVCRGSDITISIESEGGTNLGVRVRTFGATEGQRNIHVEKAIIKNHRSYAFAFFDSDSPYYNITGNYLFSDNTRLDSLVIAGSVVGVNFITVKVDTTFLKTGESGSGGRGVRIVGSSSSVRGINIDNLLVEDTIKESVSLQGVDGLTIGYIRASNTGGSLTPVSMTSCSNIKINSGQIDILDSDFSAIQTSSCDNIGADSLTIVGDVTKSTQDGWRGLSSTRCKMTNCTVTAGRYGAYFNNGSDNILVTNNDFIDVADAAKVRLDDVVTSIVSNNLGLV